MQCRFALLTLLACCYATPPPGYVKPPEVDKYPPKYEYGYTIQDNKGSGQGKLESREGVFSLGRYFVQLGGPKGASQNVEYITDEWGYHPLVEYSSIGDHSQTSTQFALGEKAVEALRKNVRTQIPAKGPLNQVVQSGVPAPSPTQTTNIIIEKQKPTPSPSPSSVTVIQTPNPTSQSKLSKVHHPVQENIPILQNAIPLQYFLQPFNLPQAQYLIQPQIEHMPQPQYLIQDQQNIPQTQFIIPLYDTGLENRPQVHQVNINLPQNQHNAFNNVQIREEQNNKNLEAQNVLTQDKKIEEENSNLEIKKNVAASNQNEDRKVTFVAQNSNDQKQNTVISIPKQEVETIQVNNGINNQQNIKYETENLEKYNNAQYQEAEKYQTENLEKYNNAQFQQAEKYQTENLEKYNNAQYQQAEKYQTENLEKYNNAQYQQAKKYQTENLEKFNNAQYQQAEKYQTENLEKYNNAQYQQAEKYQIENSDNHNNGQFLVEIKQQQPQQNIVLLPQTTQDNKVVINSGQTSESSTVKYNEKLNQNHEEIEFIAQAIQNDLNLQNTEPLFGNTVSEVRYTSNRNSASSHRKNEQNNFDESILTLENPGGYGARIKAKKPNPVSSVHNNHDLNIRLIDRTRNLVTGVDVLNINDAITNYVATAHAEAQTDQQNKNIINEYNSGNVQYGYNENVPNTILEAVTNYNNKNILTNVEQEQKVVTESNNYNNENIVQQSNIESGGNIQIEYKTENVASTSIAHSQQQNNLITSSSSYSSEANAIQNSRNKLLEILNSEKVQVQENNQNDHISLADQPIIVAELDNYQDNSVQSTTEHYKEEKNIAETVYSTTQNTVETKITENNLVSTESPILITPRPVSNSFLAPITAAVSLQNSASDIEDLKKDNYAPETSVEVQKSVPYYLGKVEYIESQENYSSQQSSEEESLSTKLIVQNGNSESESNEEQIVSQEQNESNNYPRAEALILNKGQNNLNIPDQLPEQGQIKQEISSTLELKQILNEEPPTAEAQESKVVNKPVEITKFIEKPYPVEIPIGIPYAVEKQVPFEVEKIVEKPVHITKIVEKPVPVHIPQPYPVEVEKIVEKHIKVPFEVTKYINNPYPVHIPYPEPVAVPVEVERLVQTVVKEPYPVEVPVRVEVPVKIPVPHAVHVTKYIDKPYPVEKIIEKPVTVEKIIEKPVTKYIDKPYPVHVHVPVPHPVAVPVEIKVPQPYPVEITKYIEKPYGLAQAYSAPVPKTVKPLNQQHQQPQQNVKYPVTKLVQVPVEIPKYYERQIPLYVNFHQQQKQNPYLYAPQYQIEWKNVANCELNHKHVQNLGQHRFAKIQDYIGLVPPVPPPNLDYGKVNPNYKRKARNSFEQNLRIEYGFKPPIIPSVQTDEFGMPLNKEE